MKVNNHYVIHVNLLKILNQLLKYIHIFNHYVFYENYNFPFSQPLRFCLLTMKFPAHTAFFSLESIIPYELYMKFRLLLFFWTYQCQAHISILHLSFLKFHLMIIQRYWYNHTNHCYSTFHIFSWNLSKTSTAKETSNFEYKSRYYPDALV